MLGRWGDIGDVTHFLINTLLLLIIISFVSAYVSWIDCLLLDDVIPWCQSSLENYTSNNARQHDTTQVQHETARVQHDTTRDDMSKTWGKTRQDEHDTVQHECKGSSGSKKWKCDKNRRIWFRKKS